MGTVLRKQTIAPDGHRVLRLPVKQEIVSPYFRRQNSAREEAPGRDIRIFFVYMANVKAVVFGLTNGPTTISPNILFYQDDGTVVEDASATIGVQLSGIDDQATYQSSLTSAIATYAGNQGHTVTDYIWAVGMNGPNASRSFANPSRTLNSAFQISTSRDAEVSYSVDIACASTVLAGQKGKVTLQYADDSGFTTNVVSVCESETGTSALLGLATNNAIPLPGIIPAGKYVRIATANVVGTPTFTFRRSQEVLI